MRANATARGFSDTNIYSAATERQSNTSPFSNHKSGIPHPHVLVDRDIPQEWISLAWSSLGGGKIVLSQTVDIHRISHYLAKYLTKELLLAAARSFPPCHNIAVDFLSSEEREH